MGLPEDLLEQADHLAKRDKKRPKQASLRRAVSTAYYALFHLLVSEAITYWKLERQRSSLARSFDHRKMKGICSKTRFSDADLQAVADAFVELQQARHLADYDYAKVFTRTEVHTHLNTTRSAFVQWKGVRDKDEAQDFLLAMIVSDRR